MLGFKFSREELHDYKYQLDIDKFEYPEVDTFVKTHGTIPVPDVHNFTAPLQPMKR
jgi:hypothetical protein